MSKKKLSKVALVTLLTEYMEQNVEKIPLRLWPLQEDVESDELFSETSKKKVVVPILGYFISVAYKEVMTVNEDLQDQLRNREKLRRANFFKPRLESNYPSDSEKSITDQDASVIQSSQPIEKATDSKAIKNQVITPQLLAKFQAKFPPCKEKEEKSKLSNDCDLDETSLAPSGNLATGGQQVSEGSNALLNSQKRFMGKNYF